MPRPQCRFLQKSSWGILTLDCILICDEVYQVTSRSRKCRSWSPSFSFGSLSENASAVNQPFTLSQCPFAESFFRSSNSQYKEPETVPKTNLDQVRSPNCTLHAGCIDSRSSRTLTIVADLRRCGDLFVRLILATPTIGSMKDCSSHRTTPRHPKVQQQTAKHIHTFWFATCDAINPKPKAYADFTS